MANMCESDGWQPSRGMRGVARGKWGASVVRGWLLGHGIETFPYESETISFGRGGTTRNREVDLLSIDGSVAGEVKTRSSNFGFGFAGQFENELKRMVRWRKEGTGRTIFVALVNYFGEPLKTPGPLEAFASANRVPILRFVIDWKDKP